MQWHKPHMACRLASELAVSGKHLPGVTTTIARHKVVPRKYKLATHLDLVSCFADDCWTLSFIADLPVPPSADTAVQNRCLIRPPHMLTRVGSCFKKWNTDRQPTAESLGFLPKAVLKLPPPKP